MTLAYMAVCIFILKHILGIPRILGKKTLAFFFFPSAKCDISKGSLKIFGDYILIFKN